MTVTAIIVAAGSGRRFGSETPKQFLKLAGKQIIFHTLERFENCVLVNEIILVLSESEIESFQIHAAPHNLPKLKAVVAGGSTRAASVLNGLKTIDFDKTEIIVVHDGARPLVKSIEITQTIEKAIETGAACLVAPVTDTIKEISPDNKIIGTIERAKLRRALTPQSFRADVLRRAFDNIDLSSEQATDESFLVEQLGIKVSIVEGSSQNIKITVPEDLLLAEMILKQFKI